jgi:hypothetical protein
MTNSNDEVSLCRPDCDCRDCGDGMARCDRCGEYAVLEDDLCPTCLAVVNADDAAPLAAIEGETTPVGHVTDAQLLAEYRAVRA